MAHEFHYKKSLAIDESQLDREWLEQPENYAEVAEEVADAKLVYDNLKIKFEKLKGERAIDIRTKPTEFGIKVKLTNDIVDNQLVTLPELVKLQMRLNKARYKLNKLQGAEIAWQQRKSALTKLTELYVTGYYSELRGASLPREKTKDFGRNRSEEKTAKALKKKKRKSKGE